MTLEEAIAAATRLATLTWKLCHAPSAFGWLDTMGKAPKDLASFVASNQAASAAELYTWAVADDPGAKAWRNVRREVRVTLEVFRGSFLAFYREIELIYAERVREEKVASVTDMLRRDSDAASTRPVDIEAWRRCVYPASAGTDVSTAAGDGPSELVRGHAAPEAANQLENQWDNDSGRPASRRRGNR